VPPIPLRLVVTRVVRAWREITCRVVSCGGTFATCRCVTIFGAWPVFDTHDSDTLKTCLHTEGRDREVISQPVLSERRGVSPPVASHSSVSDHFQAPTGGLTARRSLGTGSRNSRVDFLLPPPDGSSCPKTGKAHEAIQHRGTGMPVSHVRFSSRLNPGEPERPERSSPRHVIPGWPGPRSRWAVSVHAGGNKPH